MPFGSTGRGVLRRLLPGGRRFGSHPVRWARFRGL